MITEIANTVRGLVADIVEKAQSGHPGMPLGMAEVGTVLYAEVMKHNPLEPDWPDRDRFVLSAGHGSALQYALLHLTGYDLPLDELKRFRQLHSKTPGHPEVDLPGVETTTGPLGQGVSNAVGLALAEHMLATRFNRPGLEIVNHFTYAIAGDGCMMEGITSESSSLAGDLGLGKLIVVYDDNEISIEGATDLAFKEDVAKRYEAYGWQVLKIDGNDSDAILAAIEQAKVESTRPSLIVAKTLIAKGSPLEGTAASHGAPLGQDNIKLMKEKLGLPSEDFYVDPAIYEYFKTKRSQWQKNVDQWQAKFQAWSEQYPDLRQTWDRIMARQLPEQLINELPQFPVESKVATRDAGGKVLNALAAKVPELIGGSADLNPSTKTHMKDLGEVTADHYEGRNLHFGVRENAMGGIINGLSLHGGFRVFGSTFLVFADYMRPTIRLASLMHQPVIYVFTHDSFYVGEDGPTHQPIEHVESLRIIPGVHVIRPADANETAWAWLEALNRTDGPTALILTRHKIPVLANTAYEKFKQGGYIIKEASSGYPEVVILATGSEVQLALTAAKQLELEGKQVRVISVPCREVFLKQDPAYLERILGTNCLRVAIEAGIDNGWYQLVGSLGLVIGINHFGLSGTYEDLEVEFGFTTEKVVARIKEKLEG